MVLEVLQSLPFFLEDHNYRNVSLVSALLGALMGAGLVGWWAASTLSLGSLHLFLAFLGLFHLLEYQMVAVFNPSSLDMSSFLYSNFGYKEVIFGAKFGLEYSFGVFQTNRLLFTVGVVASVLGQFIRALAIITAGSSFTHQIAVSKTEKHALITSGIYSFMRHPSYCGFLLWSVGTQIMMFNPLSIIVTSYACFSFFKDRIPYEELLLFSFYGQEYREYRSRVTFSGIPFVP